MSQKIIEDLVIMPKLNDNENAHTICSVFSRNAKAQGVSSEDINAVLTAARSGDYENLKAVITTNTLLAQ